MEQLFGNFGNKLNSYLSYAQQYAANTYPSASSVVPSNPIPTKKNTSFKEVSILSISLFMKLQVTLFQESLPIMFRYSR
jgi:hypothetical protein